MMWYWAGGAYWWVWLLGLLGMAAFWGLAIWAVWYVATAVFRRPEPAGRTGNAKRILDERLARGEIDAEEYRRLRDLVTVPSRHVDATAGVPKRGQDGR